MFLTSSLWLVCGLGFLEQGFMLSSCHLHLGFPQGLGDNRGTLDLREQAQTKTILHRIPRLSEAPSEAP